jgi:hypothetical protein
LPDVLSDLQNAGNAIITSVEDASGKKLDNLYAPLIVLTNNGEAPILPSDFFGKIRLRTKDPWAILAINSDAEKGSPGLVWHKISGTEFEAEPLLINPGDNINSTVYLTSKTIQTDAIPNPPLDWDMRIANLSQIEYFGSGSSAQSQFPQLLNINVFYSGNSLLLLLGMFVAYLAVYIYYLSAFKYLSSTIKTVSLVVAAALFSIMAADVSETYLTQSLKTISQTLNAPILLLNFCALWWIAYQIRQKAAQTEDLTSGAG